MPGVERVDAAGAVLEQDAGEAAGRGADVERRPPGDGDAEGVEGGPELRLAAERPFAPEGDGAGRDESSERRERCGSL